MNNTIFVIMVLYCFLLFRPAMTREIMFLGMQGNELAAYSATIDQLMRMRLETLDGITVSDYIKTVYCRDKTDFARFPSVSKELINNLERNITDTVVIMWGHTNKIKIEPIRWKWFGYAIKGELSADITLYDISNRQYIFMGQIKNEIVKPEKRIAFFSLKKNIHISSTVQSEISDRLIANFVQSCADTIKSLMNTIRSSNRNEQQFDRKDTSAPSISDVFSVPSVEPPEIDHTQMSDSTNLKRSGVPPAKNKNNPSVKKQ